jgi:GT2 family glycosyltransferase
MDLAECHGKRMSQETTASVAIPTFLREAVLVETLEQLLRQSPPANEVIVVDQTAHHDEATEGWLRKHAEGGRIRWLKQPHPNLPKARNRALVEAKSEVVIFIDDDVVLEPGFVRHHLDNYRDPRVAAVAGRVIQAKGWAMPYRQRPWPRLLDYRFFRLDGTARVEGIASFCGCNHSVRRAKALAVGGYDERYSGWAYREDSDAAIRLWKSGAIIVFDPRASLLHLSAPAGGCRVNEGRRPLPGWALSYPAHYFAMRHLFPGPQFWADLFLRNVRRYVLTKKNVLTPGRLPAAAYEYCRGFWHAVLNVAKKGPGSAT